MANYILDRYHENLNRDLLVMHTKKYIPDSLLHKIEKIQGVDRVNRKGNYSIFVNKGRMWNWDEIELNLLSLLREESQLD